jgi:hypothetical protein
MSQARSPHFALRSYDAGATSHMHEHAQAVLPLIGAMELALGDRRGRVTDGVGVMIPARVPHLFGAQGPNRFVVLDSHLHAEFRRQLGKSPARHLADVRLDAAIARLRGGVEPIAQIALACGYSEQSALSRALRRRLAITPAAIRRS